MYTIVKVKSISKFGILDLGSERALHNDTKKKKEDRTTIDFSCLFWHMILSVDFLEDFFYMKYLPTKKGSISEEEYLTINQEIQFILEKIEAIKIKINFRNKNNVPKWNDIFFSYRLFSAILFYINDYYVQDNLRIWLREWVFLNKELSQLSDLQDNIKEYNNTQFIKEIIQPLISTHVEDQGKTIYKFEIFWPNELVMVWIMGDLIKEINPSAQIVIDFSCGNEQFDFTQWVDLIITSWKVFFQSYDYYIIDRDFWIGINWIQKYLEGKIVKNELRNVIFYNEWVCYNKIDDNDITIDIFSDFIGETFSWKNFWLILGEKAIFGRFLPYKCYWSNCNFCAINSQNKFTYNTKYSYDYFIDKWIVYIKKYDIKSLNFKDEAMPPGVIMSFARKVIQNKLKINYQIRTRFETIYTYENCKILAASGCSYMGMWLESAVERINEEIWNKWNFISIKDKLRIIHNFDKAGVAFHSYSIMWFPWETDRESAMTYKFLKANIIYSNYYTCTPNIFWLMKWPEIFANKEKYWIEVRQEDLDNPFMLVYWFTCNWKERNISLLKKFEGDLHKTQFLPWLKENKNIAGRPFWDYIDRSYTFYLLKRYHESNPFYSFMNINKELSKKSFNSLLKCRFNISNYTQIIEGKSQRTLLYDWVGCEDIDIVGTSTELFSNYCDSETLWENISELGLELTEDLKVSIRVLIKKRIFLYRK